MTVSPLEALAAIAVSLLILHIAVRIAGLSDDPRYAAFAREWGVDSPRKMFMFLQNQGFGSIPLVFAILVAARFPQLGLRIQDILGALILFVGIGGEALADAQLKNFRTDSANKGRFCDAGLWRSWGERYRDSRSRTSMFFPLPPQQGVVT
jgi:steroid 5-alpha reductase family enzyme